MSVRVTGQTQINQAVANLQRHSSSLAKVQDQIASGLRIQKPSDAPSDFAVVTRQKASSLRLDAYVQTMSDATTDLNESVSALQEGNRIMVRASQIAQEGVNGTTDAPAFETLAREVDGLIERMFATANAQAGNRYLFGGTSTLAAPFSISATNAQGQPTAITYNGSSERARGLIGPGQTVDTRYAGDAIFQQPGADAFQSLIGLRDDLRDTTLDPNTKAQALTQRLASLEKARGVIDDAIGEQAASLANLEALRSRVQDMKLDISTRVAELENTDYSEAVVKLREQDNIFQATLAVSARLMETSLLDFIR